MAGSTALIAIVAVSGLSFAGALVVVIRRSLLGLRSWWAPLAGIIVTGMALAVAMLLIQSGLNG